MTDMGTEDLASTWKPKLGALQGSRWPISYRRRFTVEEVTVLQEGFWPQDMDDRWAIWLEGSTLRLWRSWTQTCVYEVPITIHDDGSAESQIIHVLDESGDYHRHHTDAGEIDRFDGVLWIALRQERAA